jgi:hypothetical protein
VKTAGRGSKSPMSNSQIDTYAGTFYRLVQGLDGEAGVIGHLSYRRPAR